MGFYMVSTEFDICIGKSSKAEVKRLATQLGRIQKQFEDIAPAMEYRFTLDRYQQIHVKLNERALMYILYRLSEIKTPELKRPQEPDPPQWFMDLLSGK